MKENKVQEFLNDVFGEVRAFDNDGQIWFVASDVAKILDYKDQYDMTRNLDDNETDTVKFTDINNRPHDYTIINESGLYSIVLSITKRNIGRYEKAKLFKKWICGTVIPTLRKDGMYINGEENVTSQDELIKLGYEALMKKCERLEKQLTKGNVIFYKTNKTYKDVHECSKETGYDVTTIRNHCRAVGGIKLEDRLFGYVGATYNGKGELWVRCLTTGEIEATAKYFDVKYNMPCGTTNDICLGKIESFNGLDFAFEEHEKDSRFYYKSV